MQFWSLGINSYVLCEIPILQNLINCFLNPKQNYSLTKAGMRSYRNFFFTFIRLINFCNFMNFSARLRVQMWLSTILGNVWGMLLIIFFYATNFKSVEKKFDSIFIQTPSSEYESNYLWTYQYRQHNLKIDIFFFSKKLLFQKPFWNNPGNKKVMISCVHVRPKNWKQSRFFFHAVVYSYFL